jgi:hypothetical protein
MGSTASIPMFLELSPTRGGQLINPAAQFIDFGMPDPPSARTPSNGPEVECARSRREPCRRRSDIFIFASFVVNS